MASPVDLFSTWQIEHPDVIVKHHADYPSFWLFLSLSLTSCTFVFSFLHLPKYCYRGSFWTCLTKYDSVKLTPDIGTFRDITC